ncbi:MAG: hypothetical protein WAV20_13365 [Blastocatellia bacterium]
MLRKIVALIILVITFVIALLVSGCSVLSHEAPIEDVDKAAGLFFQRLDKGEYDLIYEDASMKFKENKPRQTVTENLQQLAAFGKTLGYERLSMPFQGEGKDRMLMPVYKVAFERQTGQVTLTFQDESGEWKLFGFTFKPHR